MKKIVILGKEEENLKVFSYLTSYKCWGLEVIKQYVS